MIAGAAVGLDRGGFQVVEHGLGAFAYLERAKRNEPGAILPSLIVAPLIMSGIDGYEMSKWLKADAHFSGVRLVLHSIKVREGDRLLAEARWCEAAIEKPQLFPEWLEFITRVLTEKRTTVRSWESDPSAARPSLDLD